MSEEAEDKYGRFFREHNIDIEAIEEAAFSGGGGVTLAGASDYPGSIGEFNQVGVGTKAARSDHTHGGPSTAQFGTLQTQVDGLDTRIDALEAGPVNLTDGVTINTNAALGNHFRVTLGGNRTLANPTNATDGQRILFEVTQDGTGSRTLTLGNKFAFGADITEVTLSTTAGKKDFVGVQYNSSADKFYVIAVAKGY
jgi:hypothetical protein